MGAIILLDIPVQQLGVMHVMIIHHQVINFKYARCDDASMLLPCKCDLPILHVLCLQSLGAYTCTGILMIYIH